MVDSSMVPMDPADLLEVRVVGTVVTYLKNSVLFYTSLRTPNFPLSVDAVIYSPGTGMADVAITC